MSEALDDIRDRAYLDGKRAVLIELINKLRGLAVTDQERRLLALEQERLEVVAILRTV